MNRMNGSASDSGGTSLVEEKNMSKILQNYSKSIYQQTIKNPVAGLKSNH